MSSRIQSLLRRASIYLNVGTKKESLSDELDEEVIYSKNNVCVHSVDKQNNELNHNLGYLTIKRNRNNTNISDDQKWTLCLQWTPNECLTKQFEVNYHSIDSITSNHLEIITTTEENKEKKELFDQNNDIVFESSVCDIISIDNNNENNSSDHHFSGSNDFEVKRRNSSSGEEYNRKDTLLPIKPLRCQSCRSTPLKKNLAKDNSINTFSVDLKQIKSLRLFFGGEDTELKTDSSATVDNSNGQLVIVSHDSFYKIFHFHCGGLDKLLNLFNGLDFWEKSEASKETNYLQFSICRPKLKTEECHPEEKLYISVNETQWENSINEFGQITDRQNLLKTIFFAGIEPLLRRHIWPFLLQRYHFDSTFEQRDREDSIKAEEYNQIIKKLDQMTQKERDSFWRNVESIVEKDVIRTDRSNPFFAGDNNDNIDKMKRILINFALFCPQTGYTQGMSDLLAPLLTEIQSEDKTFWCFVSMMRLTRFVCSPKDTDMDHNLVVNTFTRLLNIFYNFVSFQTLLRELLRLMIPRFYSYVRQFSNDLELLFTHRWILLCFKREFNEREALHIWESCWAHYQTYYFHLFICLAIISVYGEDVMSHQMDSDEILFHFSTLAMNMNGNIVLRKV